MSPARPRLCACQGSARLSSPLTQAAPASCSRAGPLPAPCRPCPPPPARRPPRRQTILERLSRLAAAPSVGFHERAPDGMQLDELQDTNASDPDRSPQRMWDGELDPEDEREEEVAAGTGRRARDASYRRARGRVWCGAWLRRSRCGMVRCGWRCWGRGWGGGAVRGLGSPGSGSARRWRRGVGQTQTPPPWPLAAPCPGLQGPSDTQAAVAQHAAPALGVAPHRRQRRRGACGEHAGHPHHAGHARCACNTFMAKHP